MSTTPVTHTPASKKHGRTVLLVLTALAVVIALVATGGSFAYAKQFEGKALPGTTIAGVDVAGKTTEQIRTIVQKETTGVTVTVDANGERTTVPLEEIGGRIDVDKTVEKALSRESSIPSVVSAALSGKHDVTPVVTVDEEKARAYAESLVPENEVEPVDAEIVQDDDTKEFSVVESKAGKGVDPANFVKDVKKHAPELKDFTVTQEFTTIEPKLNTEAAQVTLDKLETMLKSSLVVTGPENKTFEVKRKDRLRFVSITPNDKGDNFEISIDQEKVDTYVGKIADKVATTKKDGIVEVAEDGSRTEVSPGKDGVKVTNQKDITEKLTHALSAGENLDIAMTTEVEKAEVKEKKVEKAPVDPEKVPSELPSYAPAEAHNGEKWIDINLANKTVTAYVGDKAVWGPVSVVDGGKGTETPTGEYEIWHRTEVQNMGCTPRYDYCTKGVKYNQFFHKGYALHSAPWRSSFGYSGSHGCINMRVKDAKWLFEWASLGTKVVSHR